MAQFFHDRNRITLTKARIVDKDFANFSKVNIFHENSAIPTRPSDFSLIYIDSYLFFRSPAYISRFHF